MVKITKSLKTFAKTGAFELKLLRRVRERSLLKTGAFLRKLVLFENEVLETLI